MLADGWLGRYKIIKKIGTGGMGEVYLGEDSKLNRKIALKTLPADVGTDSERMRRFTREAKSASALNHPNIITIYEINDEDESPFIAMEYVEGETLGKIIKRGPAELAAAVDIAVQVASALAAAHDAGVVHRDVKPDNIIVRPDGIVKVLDFGLAKLTEAEVSSDPEAETVAHRTNPGMIIGTASYMSPEQARGKKVDGRSDIFSFGTVLYQMFTGKLPFIGENYVDVIAFILHQEPQPMTDIVPEVPREIESIVRKCLRKDREERFQSMRELLADLKEVQHGLGLVSRSGQRAAASSDPGRTRTTEDALAWPFTTGRHSRFNTGSISKMLLSEVRLHPVRVMAVMTALVAVIGFAGFGLRKLGDVSTAADAFSRMRFARVTSSGNVAIGKTAISPKGNLVAYVTKEAGAEILWVKQASTDSFIQIVPPGDIHYGDIAFSPDSAFIYYVKDEKNGKAAVYQVPALGGTPRKVIDGVNEHFAISPDGRQIAFDRGQTSLLIANTNGAELKTLIENSDGKRWVTFAWSPDGKKLIAAYYSTVDSRDHLVLINVTDASETLIPNTPWLWIRGLAWMPDSESFLVNGRDMDTQISQIWRFDYPNAEPKKITNDLSDYQGLSLSDDGESIVSVQQNTLSNIWHVIEGSTEPARKITNELGKYDGMSGIASTPDGGVVFTVKDGGLIDLWIVNGDGTGKRQLTFNSRRNFSPVVSQDGRYVVFVSTRGGNTDIWRMNIDGGNPTQLTDYAGGDYEPSLSPDGKWVVYHRADINDKNTIWKVSIDGGTPVQLSEEVAGRPIVSPDGKFIACEYGDGLSGSTLKLAIFPTEGGMPVRILDLPSVVKSRTFRWSADGKSLIYVDGVNRSDNLWAQPLDGSPPKQLTKFNSDRIFRFDVTSDGKNYSFSRGNETADVVMIKNFP